jgi:hypothetical protein
MYSIERSPSPTSQGKIRNDVGNELKHHQTAEIMNNHRIKLGFASKWATTNAIGKVATMGLKQPCVATRVLRTKDKRLLWGSKSYWFWCCFGLEEDIRCGGNEGPVRADSDRCCAMHISTLRADCGLSLRLLDPCFDKIGAAIRKLIRPPNGA